MYEERVKWIKYNGKRILEVDYSNISIDQIPVIFDVVYSAVSKEPSDSVSYFCNMEGTHFSMKLLDLFNKFAAKTKPFDKASALIGVTGLLKVMYDAYSKVSSIQIKTFNNREEALEWLANLK